MLDWLRQRRERRRAFEEMWRLERGVDSEGVSHFQRRAEAALEDAGFPLRQRTLEVLSPEPPVETALGGFAGITDAHVIVYQDAVHLKTAGEVFRWEDWDAASPSELIAILIDTLRRLDAATP